MNILRASTGSAYAPIRSASDGVSTVPAPSGTWSRLFGGNPAACAIAAGQLYCWGRIVLAPTNAPTMLAVTLLAGQTVTDVHFGDPFACAVYGGGERLCWGGNLYGSLGDGTMTDDPDPPAPQEAGIARVVADDNTACELTTAGNIACWGNDNYGETGQVSGPTYSASPVSDASGPLASCTALDFDGENGCAVCGGQVECWGYNGDGELGRGSATSGDATAAPPMLPPGKTWTSVVVGNSRSCALDDAGELYCWGYGPHGELGDGSHASNVPIPVAP